MKAIEVDQVYHINGVLVDDERCDDEGVDFAFVLKDGTLITDFDGCDWKGNPGSVIVKLTKKLKKGDELIEMADGSDTLWYGIIRRKPMKVDLTARKAAQKAEAKRIKKVHKQALAKLTVEEREVLGV